MPQIFRYYNVFSNTIDSIIKESNSLLPLDVESDVFFTVSVAAPIISTLQNTR